MPDNDWEKWMDEAEPFQPQRASKAADWLFIGFALFFVLAMMILVIAASFER